MANLILHIGSNLGERDVYLQKARAAIRQELGHIHQVSSLYQTAAWGLEDQPDFYNQALWIWTHFTPQECLQKKSMI